LKTEKKTEKKVTIL